MPGPPAEYPALVTAAGAVHPSPADDLDEPHLLPLGHLA